MVIDEDTRESLSIEVARSFTAQDVIGLLRYLFAIRATPEYIRSRPTLRVGARSPEFMAKSIRRCLIGRWRADYSHRRPHHALDCQATAAYAAGWILPASATPYSSEHSRLLDPDSVTQPGT